MSGEKPTRVLVVGESIVDVVDTRGHTTAHAGGSPANVALGLTRLERNPLLLTNLGPDADGKFLREFFTDNGVAVAPESFTGESTSRAVARIQPDGSAIYDFDVRWSLTAPTSRAGVRLIHTGSIAAFLPPGADVVRDLLVAASDTSLITFDPNIRPTLIGERGQVVRRFEELCALSDVVKLSDEDAAWMYPDVAIDDVLAGVLAAGSSIAVVTLGERGAILANSESTVAIPAMTTDVIDTIGAGDAFMASLIAGILDLSEGNAIRRVSRAELEDLGRRCVLAAAITVSRAGAEPPTMSELTALALNDALLP